MPLQRDYVWTHNLFPLSEPEESFGVLSTFVNLWRSKCNNGNLPAWSDFELADFVGWWGMVAVFDAVDGEPHSFRVRLWGTKLVELGGFDLSGTKLAPPVGSETEDKKQISREDVEAWREVMNTRQICFAHGPINVKLQGLGTLRYIGLPLADDGHYVDKLLYAEKAEFAPR